MSALRRFILKCRECGREYEPRLVYVCEECFGPLEVHYPELGRLNLSKSVIESRRKDLWRYLELLPIEDPRNIVSLGAGYTTLHKAERLGRKLGLRNLYLKEDITNPTHSFKDRPASVAVSRCLELGLKAVGCASTGNLAAATAAHAAKAGLPSFVFIPEGLEKEKIAQALSYGATIVEVKGTYDQANWLAARFAEEYEVGVVNVNIRPYYVEGSKTLAYEVCEQLGWKAPDHVIIPMASGALLNAINKGFNEFRELGLIDNGTRVSGAQPQGCSPIATAYQRGDEYVTPVERPETIAKSLAIGDPGDGNYALRTIRRTGGAAAAVSDPEIIEAVKDVASLEGIFVEPGAAVPVAALKRFVEDGIIDKDETVVCYLTGSGLKAPETLIEKVRPPIVIRPSVEELRKIMEVMGVA